MNDANGITARIREFEKRHGSSVACDGWIYFEDGAIREEYALGALIDPPGDPHKRANAIFRYCELRFEIAQAAFNEHKRALAVTARAGLASAHPAPPPSQESLEELKRLQAEVLAANEKLAAAKQAVEDTTPEAIINRRKQDQQNRDAHQNFLAELSEIEV